MPDPENDIVALMETIPSIRAFLRAMFANWFTAMSGPISVPLGIAAYFVSNNTATILLAITALTCVGFTAYWLWHTERQKVIELQAENKKLREPIVTEDTYAGMVTHHNTGSVTTRVTVPFYRGIRSLELEPIGSGSIKVVFDAPNDAVANAWLEQERSVDGVQYRQIRVGDPLHKRKLFFSTEIKRIDIIGDATITDVEITAA